MTLREFRAATKSISPDANLCISLQYAEECQVVDVSKIEIGEWDEGVPDDIFLVADESHCDKCGHRTFIGMAPKRTETHSQDTRAGKGVSMLTIDEIVGASVSRANRWHKGGMEEWSALEWAGAMCGEAGEAANAAKKLKRIEDVIPSINEGERHFADASSVKAQVGKEVADTILYAVLLAARVKVDLEAVLIEVFNKKSEEYGFPERLGSEDR